MIGWIFSHSWHLLGIGPLLLIVACIFAWPVVSVILIKRPWIVAVALTCVAAYVQQWRVVALKHHVKTCEAAGEKALKAYEKSINEWADKIQKQNAGVEAVKTATETKAVKVKAAGTAALRHDAAGRARVTKLPPPVEGMTCEAVFQHMADRARERAGVAP